MKILSVERHTEQELIENLRKVGLMKNPDHLVYKNAAIELDVLETEEIAPAQRYVLADELMKVRNLRWALWNDSGINLFNLGGYVTITTDESHGEPIDVLPPIIEWSLEGDGRHYKILNDGMHRVYLARTELSPIQCVVVGGNAHGTVDVPYYAFPLVGGWNDVELRNDIPDGYVKKWHRIKDYKTLYRDFNTGFQNVGGPRGHFSAKP